MASIDSAAKIEIAPSGTLRAAINFDNTILASKDAVSGEPGGVSVELARELARRLGVANEYVPYYAAGKVVEGLKSASWDICFLAIDPVRAKPISFTPPYVVIEGAYLVPRRVAAFATTPKWIGAGVRVAVEHGQRLRPLPVARIEARIDRAGADREGRGCDVRRRKSSMLRPECSPHARSRCARISGLRLLPGRFMAINQAMGMPRGRAAGARYLRGIRRGDEGVGIRRAMRSCVIASWAPRSLPPRDSECDISPHCETQGDVLRAPMQPVVDVEQERAHA